MHVLPSVIIMEIKENISDMKQDMKRTHGKVSRLKKKIVIPVIVILTGIFVFTTANIQEQVLSMFVGSVTGFSLLTIIFFLANMLKNQSWKETVKPYVAVFGLLLIWSIVFAGLRLFLRF